MPPRNVDVVLTDPPFEIGYGVFGTMQRRILESDLRATFLEGNVNLFQIRPKKELPVDLVGFDQREQLYATYKVGFEAALTGFETYTFA